MRKLSNFVLALHCECLHSNACKDAFIKKVSRERPDLLHLCAHNSHILVFNCAHLALKVISKGFGFVTLK